MGAGAGQPTSRCPAGGRPQEASLYAGSLCFSAEYRSQAGEYLRTGESAAESKGGKLVRRNGCGKAAPWKSPKPDFSTALGNPAKCAGFPLCPQPPRRLLGYIFDVLIALLKVTFLNVLTPCLPNSRILRLSIFLKRLHVPVLYSKGIRVGNVCAALAECCTWIVTGNKAILQLINDRCNVIVPEKGVDLDVVTVASIRDRLGVSPSQVPYLFALTDGCGKIIRCAPSGLWWTKYEVSSALVKWINNLDTINGATRLQVFRE